jgi:uncharacterized phiE125 gp8 family phage protein
LTTAEAKAHLNVDFSDDDTLIDAYVQAATDMVDAQWGELGRALITQRWQLTLSAFPVSGVIILPVPPVQQVTGITYYDADNAQQTLAADTYRLTVNDEFARLDKLDGASWPATYNRADAVAVQYDAGYGDAASDVPEGIRLAVRLMVGHWYENRAAATEESISELPMAVRSLLMKYRVVRGHI